MNAMWYRFLYVDSKNKNRNKFSDTHRNREQKSSYQDLAGGLTGEEEELIKRNKLQEE